MTISKVISEVYNDIGESFPHIIRLYIFACDFYNSGYFKQNNEPTMDSAGYRPGLYISDEIMDWCYENLGSGSNGKLKTSPFYQSRGDSDINWWLDWSYSHDYNTHYINGHFKSAEDAVAFRLRWS